MLKTMKIRKITKPNKDAKKSQLKSRTLRRIVLPVLTILDAAVIVALILGLGNWDVTSRGNDYENSRPASSYQGLAFLNKFGNSIEKGRDTAIHSLTGPDNHIPPVANGLAPVLSRIDTKEPVVFLGIDDGSTRLPDDLKLMTDAGVKASLYVLPANIAADPDYFRAFLDAGNLAENHTYDHKKLTELTYDEQKWDICAGADYVEKTYGRRPIFIRPSGGAFNIDTQRAAAACGMKAVVLWDAKANGGGMQYQGEKKLKPGDIVLMHFRPEFVDDFNAFKQALDVSGLHTVLLEDWL
jgi:peptidoglycan-N-acetylglucosamine deacetylase